MARVKIEFPDTHLFSTELELRISDMNYGGHMANDAVLTLAQEARIRFLKAQGYTEINIEGLGIIMTDAAVVYLSEAFHGEVLEVDIALSDFSRCGMDMLYHFREKCSQRAVCVVKTGILFFDYTTRKVKSIPETFLKRYLPDN